MHVHTCNPQSLLYCPDMFHAYHTHTCLDEQLVLCDPLHGLEEVGVEGELVPEVTLDPLEEGLIFRALVQ